jgi:hypothetical protein
MNTKREKFVMNMKQKDDLKTALENRLNPIKDRLKKMMHPNENELKDIQKELTDVVIDVSETFRIYSQKLDQFYEENKPFSKNDEAQEIEDFMKLVQDSFVTGSYGILKRWAIDYPLSNPSVLQKPLEYYVKQLKADLADWDAIAKEEGWHPESKVYWQYLVDTLDANLPTPTSVSSI